MNCDFSQEPDVAQLQRIALAHIGAERELKQKVEEGRSPVRSEFLNDAHRALYSRLSEADRTTKDGAVVTPGAFRTKLVEAGRHTAPIPESIPRFLAEMDKFYEREIGWERQLIAIACLHHCTAWV